MSQDARRSGTPLTIQQIVDELRLISRANGELRISWDVLHRDVTLTLDVDLAHAEAQLTEEYVEGSRTRQVVSEALGELFVKAREIQRRNELQ